VTSEVRRRSSPPQTVGSWGVALNHTTSGGRADSVEYFYRTVLVTRMHTCHQFTPPRLVDALSNRRFIGPGVPSELQQRTGSHRQVVDARWGPAYAPRERTSCGSSSTTTCKRVSTRSMSPSRCRRPTVNRWKTQTGTVVALVLLATQGCSSDSDGTISVDGRVQICGQATACVLLPAAGARVAIVNGSEVVARGSLDDQGRFSTQVGTGSYSARLKFLSGVFPLTLSRRFLQ